MLTQQKIVLKKIKKRLWGTAYNSIEDSSFKLLVAAGLSKILRAHKQKNQLVTAYCDSSLYSLTEALADIGFIWKDPKYTFFGGSEEDILHPYNSVSDLYKDDFDVIFGENEIDLNKLIFATKLALNSIKSRNFKTCLNPHKIAIIAAICYLCPSNTNIIEVGSYQCGTTIFMAKLCSFLGKNITIYACDTFEGMPAATNADKCDPIYYDSGMFQDNAYADVKSRISSEGVARYIRLIKGDVVDTLPNLQIENAHFMFLDTDQYKGTKAGLDEAARFNPHHILVDDTSLGSIQLAINEFQSQTQNFIHSNLLMNFDYLFDKHHVET